MKLHFILFQFLGDLRVVILFFLYLAIFEFQQFFTILAILHQQCVWYNLGAAQELLHQIRTCLARGLPTAASPQRAEPPLLLHKPASKPTHPSQGGKFVKASKGGSPTPGTTTTRPSSSTATTSPKTETKRKKKHKITKCTVTSETMSPPEKKVKLISESPDSEAEGPFRDSDLTESVSENSSHPL